MARARLVDEVRSKHGAAIHTKIAMQAQGAAACSCGGDSVVTDTRDRGVFMRRRRACLKCKVRWTTIEVRASFKEGLEVSVIEALVIARLEQLLRRMKAYGSKT